jgi:nuclear pore complex protein Nup160
LACISSIIDVFFTLKSSRFYLGPGITTTHGDFEALSAVLPAASTTQSEFSFYLHVSGLFKSELLVQHEVHFARLAISTAPSSADTSFLWSNVIKGLLDLGLYEDAYASIMATPYEKQCVADNLIPSKLDFDKLIRKRECASQLAIRMCEENAVERLMTFDFGGISDEVASALSFKARNVESHFRICYAKILYAWYVRRGDFRNGECVSPYHEHRVDNKV